MKIAKAHKIRSFALILAIFMTSMNLASGSHLIGGDLTYKRLTGNQFEVSLKLFRDCLTGQAGFDASIEIGIFERNTHNILDSVEILLTQTYPIPLNMPGSTCAPPPNICGETGLYRDTITLGPNTNGYYISWQRCCRNAGIINIVNGFNTGMVYYVEVPNPAIINNSAVFNYEPLPYVCDGQLFQLDYSATDSDGDSLVYFIAEPLAGTLGYPLTTSPQAILSEQVAGPYPIVEWTPGYNLSNVFASSPPLTINSQTGLISAKVDNVGLYAMAFEVYEYRNGVLISKIRREIEISVVICINQPPVLIPDSLPGNLEFTIFESDTLCFTATYTDTDGDNLIIQYTGDAFGGPGILTPYATATTDSAHITVNSNVCWKTRCGHARALPYVISFTVVDDGCPLPTSTLDTMLVFVKPMPLAGPVNLQCIGLVNNNTNRILWIDSSGVGEYLAKYDVYRSSNGSPYTLLASVYSDTLNYFDDVTAFDNTTNNYCYYIKGVNKCGVPGIASDTLCSFGQDNFQKNYIEFVTVKGNHEIELNWATFPDGPYSTFYIYRSQQSSPGNFELIETLVNPTMEKWIDKQVDTQKESYCYYMVNRNLCGSLSQASNLGCSILLQGTAQPLLNLLHWTPYEDWAGGVAYYEIHKRSYESGPFAAAYITSDSVLSLTDNQFEINSGVYFYFIKAYEGPGSVGAVSISNEIELNQPPFIFIPNAFSPNGDGVNDNWGSYENFVKEITVSVYNRWGKKVFEGSGYNATWDGRFDGKNVPEGLYVYVVEYTGFVKGQNFTKRGTVSVIR